MQIENSKAPAGNPYTPANSKKKKHCGKTLVRTRATISLTKPARFTMVSLSRNIHIYLSSPVPRVHVYVYIRAPSNFSRAPVAAAVRRRKAARAICIARACMHVYMHTIHRYACVSSVVRVVYTRVQCLLDEAAACLSSSFHALSALAASLSLSFAFRFFSTDGCLLLLLLLLLLPFFFRRGGYR